MTATLFAFLFADEGTFFVTQMGSRGLTGISVFACTGTENMILLACSSFLSDGVLTIAETVDSLATSEILGGIAVSGGDSISGSSRIIAAESTSDRLGGVPCCVSSSWASFSSDFRGGVPGIKLVFDVSTPKSENRRAAGL